jgi:hypothetical protein
MKLERTMLAANVRHDSRVIAPSALVVERDHALGRAAHVRHDEADTRIKFFGMPLDLNTNSG